MRILLLLAMGIVIGAVCTHLVDNALNLHHAYPRSVMTVMQHHVATLHKAVRSNQCPAQATLDNLRAMTHISDEIGPAFGTADPHFNDLAQRLRDAIAQTTHQVPADCKQLAASLQTIGGHCDDCHREYR